MTQAPRTLDALRAFFASAPFMADLGIEPIEAGEGRVVTQLALARHHHQHTGVVHAGVIGAMADHTMGAAAQTMAVVKA
jgi:acyl-coenzyme A thioesterase PaaI-like protein